MSLFIDTSKTVPFELEGTTFDLRVMTARQRLRCSASAQTIGLLFDALNTGEMDEDDSPILKDPTPEQAIEMAEAQFAILCAGVQGWKSNGEASAYEPSEAELDTIDSRAWAPLCNAIMEANTASEDDRKN